MANKRNPKQSADTTLNIELIEDSTDKVIGPDSPPYLEGEAAISGSAPDVEADDNMLDASHEVGLRQDESEEHKKPLNMAADVAKAERMRRRPPLKKK
jgi:hypothetical protein